MDIAEIAAGLELGDDGIWHAKATEGVSYPAGGHQSCFDVEERSFWFAHRNRCIMALIGQFPPPAGGPLADVGGGNGFVSCAIAAAGIPVVLVEPGLTGARHARERGLANVVCSSLQEARFAEGSFAAAGLFDVIEHVSDDTAFLRTLRPLIQAGGALYVTTPALPLLWSDEDDRAGHYRRYTTKSLADAAKRAGFTVDFATYFFRVLPLPLFVLRTIPSRFGRRSDDRMRSRDHAARSRVVRSVAERLLRSEVANIGRRAPMRMGSSVLMAARA